MAGIARCASSFIPLCAWSHAFTPFTPLQELGQVAGEVNILGVIAVALFIIIPGTPLPSFAPALSASDSPLLLQWPSS